MVFLLCLWPACWKLVEDADLEAFQDGLSDPESCDAKFARGSKKGASAFVFPSPVSFPDLASEVKLARKFGCCCRIDFAAYADICLFAHGRVLSAVPVASVLELSDLQDCWVSNIRFAVAEDNDLASNGHVPPVDRPSGYFDSASRSIAFAMDLEHRIAFQSKRTKVVAGQQLSRVQSPVKLDKHSSLDFDFSPVNCHCRHG